MSKQAIGTTVASEPPRRWAGWLLAIGVVFQGWGLVATLDVAPAARALAALGCVALAVGVERLWRQATPAFARDMVSITAVLGGLGMLLGTGVDHWRASGSAAVLHAGHGDHALHASHGSGLDLLAAAPGMTLGMLLFCVPGCLLLCRPCAARSTAWRIVAHAGCLVGMLVGMALGAAWSWPEALAAAPGWLGATAEHHLRMVVGMALGAGAAALIAARWPRRRLEVVGG